MKKVRIPFDLTEYKKGGYKVETRGDENHKPHPVRIFAVDLLSRYQTIVGAEKIENREVVGCWFYNGNFFSEDEENYRDLLLVKEEFEDGDIIISHGQVINFIIPCWNAETKQVEDIKSKCIFKPFDKVLVRDFNIDKWFATSFSDATINGKYRICDNCYYDQCIPYNDETKHLIGTTDDAPEKYKTW